MRSVGKLTSITLAVLTVISFVLVVGTPVPVSAREVGSGVSPIPNVHTSSTCYLPPSSASGAKLIYTVDMVNNFLGKKLIPELAGSLLGIAIPDIDGTAQTPTGYVEYSISDAVVSECRANDSDFIADSTSQILRVGLNLTMAVEFNYKYQKTTPPYIGDEGAGRISIESLSLNINLETHHDADGVLGFSIVSAPTVIKGFSISLDSPLSWLYDLIFAIVEDDIVAFIERNVEEAAIAYMDSLMETIKPRVHLCFLLGQDVMYDIRVLSNGFEVGPSYIWMGYSFMSAVVSDNECDCAKFEDSLQTDEPLPDILTNNMWQFPMSRLVIEELFENYGRAGYFDASFNAMTVPEYSDMLTGEYWVELFPDLSAVLGPSDPVTFSVDVTEGVKFTVYPAVCLIEIPVHATLGVLPTNDMVLEMDLIVSFTLVPASDDPLVLRLVFISECDDVQLLNSTVPPADANLVYMALLDIQEALLQPSFDETFLMSGFNIVSISAAFPEVTPINGRFVLGTDHGGYVAWVADLEWGSEHLSLAP